MQNRDEVKQLDLAGLGVLVTRPDPGGIALCGAINAEGGVAYHFPTISFVSLQDQEAYQKSLACIAKQDGLIFISPQAVRATLPDILRAWPTCQREAQVAAVGAGTAEMLKAAGFQNIIYPEKDWSSEGLLAKSEFQQVAGKKIALIQGEGGRGLLMQALHARGAAVLSVIAYRRMLPDHFAFDVLTDIKANKIDVIICTSYESVRNLKTLIGDAGWSLLQALPIIVVSERIKTLAHGLFFQTIWVAQNAGTDAILNILRQKRKELWQKKS